jgi:hypothetical protein
MKNTEWTAFIYIPFAKKTVAKKSFTIPHVVYYILYRIIRQPEDTFLAKEEKLY